MWRLSLFEGSAAKCCPTFAASLRLTLDYDALIETDSHNDDQQEDKNAALRNVGDAA
jgi:hypothetical protein